MDAISFSAAPRLQVVVRVACSPVWSSLGPVTTLRGCSLAEGEERWRGEGEHEGQGGDGLTS